MEKTHRKHDIILIICLLLASLAVFTVIHFTRSSGNMVVITQDGQELASLPLSADYEHTFIFESSYNTVVIHNGEVSVSEAGCPDHICVKTGKISYNGESIICLPNKFVVTVISDNNLFDSVAN